MKSVTRKSQSGNPHADAAYEAGREDALNGIVGGGWEYAGGTLEDSYRLGFLAGSMKVEQPKRLAGGSPQRIVTFYPPMVDYRNAGQAKVKSEADLMDADLEAIRSGAMPIVQMTDELLEEIENALF